MAAMGKAIVELSDRSRASEHEQMRLNKWTADNPTRLMQLEGRVNEEVNKGQALTLEKFKATEDYMGKQTFEERINRIDELLGKQDFEERIDRIEELLADHNFCVDHLYQVKPAEEYTINSGFEAVAQQSI